MLILEELEEDYNWKVLKEKKGFNIFKGQYLFEDYIIVEDFEYNEESVLYFFPLTIENEVDFNNINELSHLLPKTDFFLEGVYLENEHQKYSIYKDEEDILILNHLPEFVMVYEDTYDLIEELKEDFDDDQLSQILIEEKNHKKFDFVLFAMMHSLFYNK